MSTTCKKCGKPVRPGAKFCGSCGEPVPPTTPEAGPPAQQAAPVQGQPEPVPAAPLAPRAGMIACPHCGSPVRMEARFCAKCGQSISTGVVQPTPQQAAQQAQQAAPPPAAGVSAQAAAQPQSGGAAPKSRGEKLSGFIRKNWVLLVVVGSVLCLLAVAGVYLFSYTPLFKEEPAPTGTPLLTQTDTPVLTPTWTVVPTETETVIPTDTATAVPPTSTDTQIPPTLTDTPVPPTETATQAPPTAIPTPIALIDEKFDQPLEVNWLSWGVPLPQINAETMLELQSTASSEAGVSSKLPLPLLSGTVIQIQARIADPAAPLGLSLDWDVGEGVRLPGTGPGAVRVQIANGQSTLLMAQNPSVCQQELKDADLHTYEIRVDDEDRVYFFIDGKEACSIAEVLPDIAGRVSISGAGWVDTLKVLIP